MSDIVLIVVGIVSLALSVMWVLTMLATLRLRDDVVAMRKSLEHVAQTGQATMLILNERHQWDVQERKLAAPPAAGFTPPSAAGFTPPAAGFTEEGEPAAGAPVLPPGSTWP